MINKVILVGRLGADPELKYTGQGTPVANFSVATSKSWVKDGNREERTQWHRIVAWSKLAEVCAKHIRKGSQVYIEGEIETREYEKNGERRFSTEIVAQTVQFLGGRPSEQGASNEFAEAGEYDPFS